MFNVQFIGTATTVPIITTPTNAQWESAYFTEEYCNGYDPFFEFGGDFLSIEHDCWAVDQMSRLYQSVVEFDGKPPTHWTVHEGKLYALYQDGLKTITTLEFQGKY